MQGPGSEGSSRPGSAARPQSAGASRPADFTGPKPAYPQSSTWVPPGIKSGEPLFEDIQRDERTDKTKTKLKDHKMFVFYLIMI